MVAHRHMFCAEIVILSVISLLIELSMMFIYDEKESEI